MNLKFSLKNYLIYLNDIKKNLKGLKKDFDFRNQNRFICKAISFIFIFNVI